LEVLSVNNTGSLEVWRRLLSTVVPGEMTVRQWCDQQGITEHQYYYWRRRIAAAADEKTAEGRWLAVKVTEPTPAPTVPGGVTVRIAGAAIELQSGFDPSMLRAVVRALSADPC
jgi:hypothetical protein